MCNYTSSFFYYIITNSLIVKIIFNYSYILFWRIEMISSL
nr:MAG TPA: hypothetical protein [Caudoviricetes sp.]